LYLLIKTKLFVCRANQKRGFFAKSGSKLGFFDHNCPFFPIPMLLVPHNILDKVRMEWGEGCISAREIPY
jgi:hypothetical protein